MFKYWTIKRYGTKLLPTLERNFGCKDYYTASEVRTSVFKNNFSSNYLPLGYLLFLDDISLKDLDDAYNEAKEIIDKNKVKQRR